MAELYSPEVAQFDEALEVLDSALSHIKWRLKSSSKRRLEIDVMALCTRMRPVVMVDYGGKMPELQERLCAFLKVIQKGLPIFEHLRVMVIEDMIYMIHKSGLAEHVSSSLNLKSKLLFADLEHDPPKIVSLSGQNSAVLQLASIQKLFSLGFPLDQMNNDLMPCCGTDGMGKGESSNCKLATSQTSEVIDLSHFLQDSRVTLPTLNGWLLGYPIVYLFGKEHIADAIYNLSTKSLHIFKIIVCRNSSLNKEFRQEELMSFSVPYDLSMGGSREPWAEAFLMDMRSKWERCKQVWRSLQMEVSECNPQAIVL